MTLVQHFDIMQAFPYMDELWAITDKYEHYAKPHASITSASYNEAWISSLSFDGNPEDNQHNAMD